MPGSVRLVRPDSTRPAPSSRVVPTPRPAMVSRHSRQRTRAVTCSTSRPAIVAGSRSAAALTLLISGTAGGRSVISASAARTASAAGASSRQWNGALTASSIARPPLALARPTARSTAARAPLSTT